MSQDLDDLLKRVRQKHLNEEDDSSVRPGKSKKISGFLARIGDAIGDFLEAHTKTVAIAIGVLMILLVGVFWLTKDYVTKRQNYPERNVLFRSTNVVYIAGSSEEKGTESADQLSETQVYEGGVESKVGTYLFTATRETRDDIESFNMDNSQKIRIASATKKPEIVQAGLRVGGSLNFKEQFAEIILDRESKAPQSYRVYKFVPERGLEEIEVTVAEKPDGSTILENRMTEKREFLLGWLWGKTFRRGTDLEQYVQDARNAKAIQNFQESIKILDSRQTNDQTVREKKVREVMALSKSIETTPIYITYEDGFFDYFPQDSTNYLAHKPNWFERAGDGFLGKSEHIRLRTENYRDLFPGRYPLLQNIHFGKGDNMVYPFNKYNNGGYVIHDTYGKLAQIDIQDFILFYGQDVLYSYYLDLNGDGKLDKQTELIGTVLCRTTHDDRVDLETLVGEGRAKTDVTFTTHYSFMAPETDFERGMDFFKLCGYIESMLPDQVNHGFGRHSLLGYINAQRSDIMLFKDLTIENMSRALTQESTLVAKYDIVKALTAARRPYAKELADAFGISDEFDEQFEPSSQLKERRDWHMIIVTSLLIVVVFTFFIWRVKRKNAKREA
ncbi:MAG: hypothetical protein GY801_08215 [bacterium]|nr:hypothetical protein [bacterium]